MFTLLIKSLKCFLLFILFTFFATKFLLAQEVAKEKSVRFLLEGGLEYGGDEIVEVLFTNGETQVMRSGQGGLLAAGLRLQPTAIKWAEVRATIGLKANTTAADNANIFFIRYPVNLLAYFDPSEDIRIGGGITKHLGPKLNGDGFLPDQVYTSPMGLRFEVGYKGLVISYNQVKYIDLRDAGIGANSFGIGYSHLF